MHFYIIIIILTCLFKETQKNNMSPLVQLPCQNMLLFFWKSCNYKSTHISKEKGRRRRIIVMMVWWGYKKVRQKIFCAVANILFGDNIRVSHSAHSFSLDNKCKKMVSSSSVLIQKICEENKVTIMKTDWKGLVWLVGWRRKEEKCFCFRLAILYAHLLLLSFFFL